MRVFPSTPRLNYTLRCGSEAEGYRHVLIRHRSDFEQLAFGTQRNWRDIADLAMETIATDPDAAVPVGDGKGCLSRVIFLVNLQTNQVVRQQIIRMIVRNDNGNILTVYPDSRQCIAGG